MASVQAHNRILARLKPADLRLIEPHLTQVDLPLRRDLEKPNQQIANIFFIESGIASVVAVQRKEVGVEIGLIGCEGMSGTSITLNANSSPHSTYMQVAGGGQRIAAADLRAAMGASKSLHELLLHYVQAFMVQTSHTAVVNARGKLAERLARWLLMAHDRVRGDTLPLTHEFLALMLAVRRAGVTEALQALSGKGIIESHRGSIVVLNRKELERMAADLYGVPEAEYRRLLR